MWKISKYLILAVSLPFLLVGFGLIYYGYTMTTGQFDIPGFSMKGFYIQMGVFFIIITLITLGGILLFYGRTNRKEMDLIENGLKGQATILQRQQTGMYMNEQPQVKFLLEIQSPDGDTYQLEHKEVVSLLNLGSINVGSVLPVYIDPNNKKNILISYQ